jgi:hypothetical protein
MQVAREGSESHIISAQAMEIANQARALGLNTEADLMTKSLYQNIKNKDKNGWPAAKALVVAVAEKVKHEQEKQHDLSSKVTKLATMFDFAKQSGLSVDTENISAAKEMIKNKNVDGLAELSRLIDASMTRQAVSQQKILDAQAKGKMDPSAQIEANKAMASKLLLQFHTAQKILNDPEATKAFTSVPKVRAFNEETGVGNNIKEYMATISGFNLGKGMQEVKEMTGTGSGMSEAETSAFRAAQSSLSMNQDWPNAAESLNIFNSSIIRSLKKLGVRNEYLTGDGAKTWLTNTDANLPLLDIETKGGNSKTSGAPQTAWAGPQPTRSTAATQSPQPMQTVSPGIGMGTPVQSSGGVIITPPAPTLLGQPIPDQSSVQGQDPSQESVSTQADPQQPDQPAVDPYAAARSKLSMKFNLNGN